MTLQWTPDCVSTTTALGLEGKQQPLLLLHAVLYFAFLPPFLRHLHVLRPTFVTKSIVNNAVPLILLLETILPSTNHPPHHHRHQQHRHRRQVHIGRRTMEPGVRSRRERVPETYDGIATADEPLSTATSGRRLRLGGFCYERNRR